MSTIREEATTYLAGKEPVPTGLAKADVERLAERFAGKVGYVPAASIEDVVAHLGGKIEFRDLDELTNQTGSLDVRGRADFTIFLPWYTGRLRDRFTIAHELGHYVLHSRLGQQPIRVGRAESNELEWEANWFAAALLMPQAEFERLHRKGASIPYLAAHFDVSPAAAEVRARALGLDKDRQATPD